MFCLYSFETNCPSRQLTCNGFSRAQNSSVYFKLLVSSCFGAWIHYFRYCSWQLRLKCVFGMWCWPIKICIGAAGRVFNIIMKLWLAVEQRVCYFLVSWFANGTRFSSSMSNSEFVNLFLLQMAERKDAYLKFSDESSGKIIQNGSYINFLE